jgi:septal ring factor EnvC (AmiA/AmiB activator)
MLRTFLFILLSCTFTVAVADDQRAQTKQQIAQAAKEIAELKKQLGKIQQEKSTAEQALKKTETEIGSLEKQVNTLKQQEKDTAQELVALNQKKAKLQDARQQQQKLIAIQARAAFQAGQQEPLRLLLNQQQPEKFSRNLTYYQYIGQARQQQITEFNTTLQQLADIATQITEQQRLLAEQRTSLATQQETLQTLRKQRQQKVAAITQKQRKEAQSLQTRQADQAALNTVLSTIEATLARQAREAKEAERRQQQRLAQQQRIIAEQQRQSASSSNTSQPVKTAKGPMVSTAFTHSGGSFANVRGRLPWPINGRLIAHFGSARGDSRAKWDGVMISSPAGTQVRAIHPGRVVFADWLRGAGLLIIIDHGDGYLSLYGHNQSLLSRPGDRVKVGQAISTVGNTGGRDQAALYFAIRQRGQPIDPIKWCRTQG